MIQQPLVGQAPKKKTHFRKNVHTMFLFSLTSMSNRSLFSIPSASTSAELP